MKKRSNFFNRHLLEIGETYFEHLLFLFAISIWLISAGIILFIHAFLPFLFEVNASKHIKKINSVMQQRNQSLMKRKAAGIKGKEKLKTKKNK